MAKSRKRSRSRSRAKKSRSRSPKKDCKSFTGYCVSCKKKVKISGGKRVTLKNRRHACKGVCSKCDTGVFRFVA